MSTQDNNYDKKQCSESITVSLEKQFASDKSLNTDGINKGFVPTLRKLTNNRNNFFLKIKCLHY